MWYFMGQCSNCFDDPYIFWCCVWPTDLLFGTYNIFFYIFFLFSLFSLIFTYEIQIFKPILQFIFPSDLVFVFLLLFILFEIIYKIDFFYFIILQLFHMLYLVLILFILFIIIIIFNHFLNWIYFSISSINI